MSSTLLRLNKAILVIFIVACISPVEMDWAQANESHEEIERIQQKGILTIAMHSVDAKPFYEVNGNGELVGFDVDIARDIAKRMGVEVEFNRSAKTFDGIVDLIVQKEADIAISMLSNTLSRAMKVRFSDPYITLYRTLVTNRQKLARRTTAKNIKITNDYKLIQSLEGIKIGSIEGSSYVGFAKEDFPKAIIVPYKDLDSIMQAILAGKILAGLYDNIEIANWSFAHPTSAIYTKTTLLKDKKDTLSFAVHNENEYLFHWLNLYLRKITDNGTRNILMEKYFPDMQGQLQ